MIQKKKNKTLLSLVRFHCGKIVYLLTVKFLRSEKQTNKQTKNTKIMASRPITSWHIEKEKVEAVTDFIFLGSKISEDDDCSH